MKANILNGLLLLAPVAVLMVILEKAFGFARQIAKPIEQFYPIDRVFGVLLADLLAAALLIALCYTIGAAEKRNVFGGYLKRLDNFFFDIIPGYAVVKGVLAGVTKAGDQSSALKPVLIRFDDYDQIAFEIERSNELVVVFLPGSPSAWSGTSIIVSAERVSQLNIPFSQATGLMRTMGKGSLKHTSEMR